MFSNGGSNLPRSKSASTLDWPLSRPEHGTDTLATKSPGLTPFDYFSWGYIKGRVFIPPLPVSVNDLKQRITTVVGEC